MKTSEAIEIAIERLQVDGWGRGGMGDPGSPHCMVGAFPRFVGRPRDFPYGYQFSHELWVKARGNYWRGAIHWNDQEAADVHEVIAMLLTMLNLALKEKD